MNNNMESQSLVFRQKGCFHFQEPNLLFLTIFETCIFKRISFEKLYRQETMKSKWFVFAFQSNFVTWKWMKQT